MKKIQCLALCAAMLLFCASAFAKTKKAQQKLTAPLSTYVLHVAMQDNGPGTSGTENYTIYTYVTDQVDTTYTSRITNLSGSTYLAYWDAPTDGFHADIVNGASYGSYYVPNYFPPHSTLSPSFFSYTTYGSTFNGHPVVLDTNVIYFTTFP